MKKAALFNLYVMILIAFSNIGCRDNCSCEGRYKRLPEEIKPWFMFNEGSYWIYVSDKDSTITDTMILSYINDKSSNKFCEKDYSPAKDCSESISVYLNHSNVHYFPRSNDSSRPGSEIYQAYIPNGGGGEILSNSSLNSGQNSIGPFLALPIIIGENYDDLVLLDTNSLTIDNQIFYNTIHSKKVSKSDNNILELWWSKNIGMLKYIKSKGKKPEITWVLKTYLIK